MKRVLVTGSEGGIGRYIVPALESVHRGSEIRRVNRYPGLELTTGDLRDRSFAHAITRGADTVIHAAARRYSPSTVYPFDLIAHDIDVATSVLEAALDSGVRHVVLLSSATVYAGNEHPSREYDDTCVPASLIGRAKLAIEHSVRAWSDQTGGTHTIWRLCHVVTPLEAHDRPAHAHVDLYRKIFVDRMPRIRIDGPPHRRRVCTWVGDVADAIAVYLDDSRARNMTFNLASETERTLLQVANELVAAGRHQGYLPDDYDPLFEVDTTEPPTSLGLPSMRLVREKLGWTAPTSFSDCIRRFVVGKATPAPQYGKATSL